MGTAVDNSVEKSFLIDAMLNKPPRYNLEKPDQNYFYSFPLSRVFTWWMNFEKLFEPNLA